MPSSNSWRSEVDQKVTLVHVLPFSCYRSGRSNSKMESEEKEKLQDGEKLTDGNASAVNVDATCKFIFKNWLKKFIWLII